MLKDYDTPQIETESYVLDATQGDHVLETTKEIAEAQAFIESQLPFLDLYIDAVNYSASIIKNKGGLKDPPISVRATNGKHSDSFMITVFPKANKYRQGIFIDKVEHINDDNKDIFYPIGELILKH